MKSPTTSAEVGVPRAPRLLPRWFGITAVLLLAVVTAVLLVAGLLSDGLGRMAGLLLALVCVLVGVSAVRALLWPRRRRQLATDANGVTVIRSPATVAWPLVQAWILGLVVIGVWVVVAARDFSDIESPGFTLLAVIGALGSLPDLYRLLTGRLHRWELTLGPDGYRYRGYRTDDAAPWSKVKGASIQRRGPAGVRIERKGTGADVVVPAAAFGVPAEQIVEEIEARIRRR